MKPIEIQHLLRGKRPVRADDAEFMGVKRGKILDFGPMGRIRRSLYIITTLSGIPYTIGCSYSFNVRCQRCRRREIADVLTVISIGNDLHRVY
jgi:hypothetical protein